jgi:hypothetical protein
VANVLDELEKKTKTLVGISALRHVKKAVEPKSSPGRIRLSPSRAPAESSRMGAARADEQQRRALASFRRSRSVMQRDDDEPPRPVTSSKGKENARPRSELTTEQLLKNLQATRETLRYVRARFAVRFGFLLLFLPCLSQTHPRLN